MAHKMPGESPYSVLGNSPITLIDPNGDKRVYRIYINGELYEQKVVSNELIHKTNQIPSTAFGIPTHDYTIVHDWYDQYVDITYDPYKDAITARAKDVKVGTTFFNWGQSYARANIWANNLAEKDTRVGQGGYTFTSSVIFKGNDHHLNATGRAEIVNADEIVAAFGAAKTASGADGIDDLASALRYLRDWILFENDAQTLAPIDTKNIFRDDDSIFCNFCEKKVPTANAQGHYLDYEKERNNYKAGMD